jgi:hypothetical protein
MNRYHSLENIKIEQGILSVIVDKEQIQRKLIEISPVLAQAKTEDISVFEISLSGYGIHWPVLDEDISIDGLLGIVHSPTEIKMSA